MGELGHPNFGRCACGWIGVGIDDHILANLDPDDPPEGSTTHRKS